MRKGRYTRGSLLPQQAPTTDLLLELAPSYLTSLVQWSKDPGAKILLRNNFFFCVKSLVQTRELCSGSMLRERVAGASSLVCTGLKGVKMFCYDASNTARHPGKFWKKMKPLLPKSGHNKQDNIILVQNDRVITEPSSVAEVLMTTSLT